MSKKTKMFGEVKEGHSIFYINPLNTNVEEVVVKRVEPHKKYLRYMKIIYYAPSTRDDTLVDQNPELEDLPTLSLIIEKTADFIITTGKVPIPFCTTKEKLEEWMLKV